MDTKAETGKKARTNLDTLEDIISDLDKNPALLEDDFPTELLILKELIANSISIVHYINNQIKEDSSIEMPLNEQLSLGYFHCNCQYSLLVYDLIRRTYYTACGSIQRTMLESIYTIYYINLHPSALHDIYAKEKTKSVSEWRSCKYHTPYNMRNYLYTPKTRALHDELYYQLCKASHPY